MPIAAVAPELLVVIAVALLLVVLIVNVQLYQNGKQARSFAVGLPVVSGPVVTAIDWLIGFDIQAARFVDNAFEGLLIGSAQALANYVVAVWKTAGALLLALIHNTAATAARAEQLATHIQTVELVAINRQLVQLSADIAHVEQVETAAIRAAVASLEAIVATDLQRALAATAIVESQLVPYLPMLSALAALPADAAQTILRLMTLTASLSTAVGVLDAQIGQLEAGASALERTIASQQALLAKLAALLGLAALGAVALTELARIARNPCEVCAGLNLNDLEGRVASIELSNY